MYCLFIRCGSFKRREIFVKYINKILLNILLYEIILFRRTLFFLINMIFINFNLIFFIFIKYYKYELQLIISII